jgi:hypothetical protein
MSLFSKFKSVFVAKEEVKPVVVATVSPKERAARMTADEKAELIALYGNTNGFTFNADVVGVVEKLHVKHIDVFGIRFNTIREALTGSSSLTEAKLRHDLETFDEELALVRRERLNDNIPSARQYRIEDTLFDGKVYIYKPGLIAIQSQARINAGLAPRMALRLTKKNDGQMHVTHAYLAKEDIANATNRTAFDMREEEYFNSFNALVIENPIFKDEVAVIIKTMERIEHFNTIVKEGRYEEKNGIVNIKAPKFTKVEAERTTDPNAYRAEEETVERNNEFENIDVTAN